MLHHLEKIEESQLADFRLEVTVQTATLQAAIEQIAKTLLLSLPEYLEPTYPDMEFFKIQTKYLTKEDIIYNATMMIGAAQNQRQLRQRNAAKANSAVNQIIRDCYAAIGWNLGTAVIRWNADYPWWVHYDEDLAQDQEDNVVAEESLSLVIPNLDHINGVAALRRLFDEIRTLLKCPQCQTVGSFTHRGNKNQLRVACSICKKDFNQSTGKKFFLDSINAGQIPPSISAVVNYQPFQPAPQPEGSSRGRGRGRPRRSRGTLSPVRRPITPPEALAPTSEIQPLEA